MKLYWTFFTSVEKSALFRALVIEMLYLSLDIVRDTTRHYEGDDMFMAGAADVQKSQKLPNYKSATL